MKFRGVGVLLTLRTRQANTYTECMALSPIQNSIISQLKNAAALRYRDMRPADTPNDLYNYHLKQLIAKNIVRKTTDGYQLTEQGLRHVADVHHTSDQANRLFKINVITIVSRVIDNQLMILSQVRNSNPSFGKVGVMGGTILKGESIQDGASRKLRQETGVTATFTVVGSERRMMYKDGDLFSDVLFPIAYSNSSKGEPTDTEFGHNLWVPIDLAIEHNNSDPYDSIAAITTALEAIRDDAISSLPFFFTETKKHN